MCGKCLVERLGWRPSQVPLDTSMRMFDHLRAAEAQYGTDMIKKCNYVERSWSVAYYAYILEEVETAREWALRTGSLTEEYFFGSWRDTVPSGNDGKQAPNRGWYDFHAPWVQPLQYGLLATIAVGDMARLTRIVQFPFEHARRDHGVDAACDHFWLLLTRLLRCHIVDTFAFPPECGPCNHSDQLLLRFLEGIVRKDAEVAQRFADLYFESLNKTHAQGILLWLDGSILLHLAKDYGVRVRVSESVRDRIYRLGGLSL